jgi:glucose/arabinose dehydrogenase
MQPLRTRAAFSLAALATFSTRAAADFNYPDFWSTTGFALVGSAAQVGTRIRLTPALNDQVGGLWWSTKEHVANGFDTTFAFQLSAGGGADGFALVIQNQSSSPLGASGCELGYNGIANSIAIEFDTYVNATCGSTSIVDPHGIHVSVHSLGTAPNSVDESASLGSTIAVPSFTDGAVHVGRVKYAGGTLSVFIDDLVLPVLNVTVVLPTFLNLDQGTAWVGFVASTGGAFEQHDLHSWVFTGSTPGSGNFPPATPAITEPAVDGQTVNPADVHMETGPFSDVDAGDQHRCTDWEIWTIAPSQRVWSALCITGVERVHTHLGDGVFENALAGQSELNANTNYRLRVRHSDDSGVPATEWSGWAQRTFHTGGVTQVFPLEVDEVANAPAPHWFATASGNDFILQPAATSPWLRLESATGQLLYSIEANDGITNTSTNPPALPAHVAVRLQIRGGSAGLTLPMTDLVVADDHCDTHAILIPAVTIAANTTRYWWISSAGATYNASAGQTTPTFGSLARGLSPPWHARQDGFKVEVFAGGFQLPVNIAFVPNPGPNPSDPFLYVTELYGKIKVVTRGGTVSDYATGLLNFNPTGAFPGSGEQGLTGIAVDPQSGDVFAAMLYASAAQPSVHFPKISRFTSTDGGLTAANQITVLDMANESQGQSHQISNLTITPTGKLICHMGDGFDSATALNLNSFRGKILRLELNGAPVTDNPFYNAADGINARDYIFAYGVRNPFGGAWRALDSKQYVVENGPSVDRITKVEPGRNFGWTGSDASMSTFALYNWNPAHGPVNMVWIQPETFAGSGFPQSSMGHAYISESGPTYATGLQTLGKRITEWIFDASGTLVAGPIPFLEYAGSGKATACGLEAGPDGLYMTELYNDTGTNATQAGARILRIRFDPAADCNSNGIDDVCDIADGTSPDANANQVPDECECAGTNYCQTNPNSTGQAAHMSANAACVMSTNGFVITAAPVTNALGMFFYGANQVNGGAGLPFYDGYRCVGSPVFRLPIITPSSNVATYALDFANLPPNGAITIGSTWHFQYWHRDIAAGGSGANLSDGLTVTFR